MILSEVREVTYIKTIEFLDVESVPHFLGGSRFFGYGSETSDYDIYVNPTNSAAFEGRLRSEGYISDPKSANRYPADSVLYTFHGLIHIVVCPNHKWWDLLRKEHLMVKDRLEKHPELLAVCKYLKRRHLMPGRDVYRMIRDYPKII